MRHPLLVLFLVGLASSAAAQPAGPLGASVQDFGGEGAVVQGVDPGSRAAGIGLQPGDIVLRVGSRRVVSAAAFGTALAGAPCGAAPELTVVRQGRLLTLAAAAAPLAPPVATSETAQLGLELLDQPWGVTVARVRIGSRAACAGVRSGDLLLQAGRTSITDGAILEKRLRRIAPGSELRLKVLRRGRALWRTVTVGEVE